MKFYTVRQNNSGGYFINNDDVGEYVVVQANSPKQAENIVEKIIYDHSEYCECCGERWWVNFDNEDGEDFISNSYGEEIDTKTSFYEKDGKAVIYFLDGRKEYIYRDL